MLPLLVYIHGFKSSPQSEKAMAVRHYIDAHKVSVEYQVPSLPDCPKQSFRLLTELLDASAGRKIALIGSSMGGFMATALAEHYDVRAVLINPAVYPSKLIMALLGDHENPYTGQRFTLDQSDVEAVKRLEVSAPRAPQNLLLMVQTGDETLDYRLALHYYRDCPQVVEEGGDHRFQNFERHLPEIFQFLQLESSNKN